MTLRTRIYLIISLTFLFLFLFQYLIVRYYLIEHFADYIIILFLVVTTVVFSSIIILYIENRLLSRIYHLDETITNVVKSNKNLARLSATGKDEISRLTDYLHGMLEELQQSKEDLRNSNSLLTTAQKFASMGSWYLALKTGKVNFSEEMSRITGLDATHVGSNDIYAAHIIHPEDRQFVKEAFQAASHENTICNIDYRCIMPGGSLRTLHMEGEVKYDKAKQLFSITGVLYDITKHVVLNELHAADLEETFHLLDINPNPVIITDEDTVIRYVNRAFEKMIGFRAEDVLGVKPPYPWWPEDLQEKYAKELQRRRKTLQAGEGRKVECLFRKKRGKNIWVEVNIRYVRISDNIVYHFVFMFDITERKRLENNMQFYLAEITRAQEAERKRIALEIHDDIIQSLASLCLEIDALGRNKDRLPDDLPKRLQGLREGTQEVADRLRLFSHELHPSVIDQSLVPALEVLAQENSRVAERNVQFTVYGQERELSLEEEISLFRIAQEAVRNIAKHSGAQEAKIELRYTPKSVKLIISDNGVGFELPEMLEDFASKQKLGIIGMQERSRLLNGKLSIRSRVGKGTVVKAEVPIIKR